MARGREESSQTASKRKLAMALAVFQLLTTDCEKNIEIIIDQASILFDASYAFYYRLAENKKSLIYHHGINVPDDLKTPIEGRKNICTQATLNHTEEPTFFTRLDETPFHKSDIRVARLRTCTYFGLPVTIDGKIIGSLCFMDRRNRSFNETDTLLIQNFAAALSLEEKKRLEDEHYRLLVESSNDAIYVVQNNRFDYFNPIALKMTGFDAAELSDMRFTDLIHPDDREMIIDAYHRRLRGEDVSPTYEFRVARKDKEIIWAQINAVKIQWKGQPAVLAHVRNVNRLKELETKLKRAEKMELVGTMAGGVAHDLNNILSGLVSYPELLLMQLPKNSPFKEPIAFMHDAGIKAADIVQDLLTLTRRGVQIENIINLNHLVHEYFTSPAHKRLEKNYPGIRFTVESEKDLLNILGSGSHILKIIMNLIMNAAEAIKDRGHVQVSTCNRYIDMPLSGYDTIEEGDYVVLSVNDNGGGIAKDDLNRIFEPFYTKKQMGRSGTGLGLSVVWNCVKDHNGYIEINSTEHEGTVFDLFFPATRKDGGSVPDDFDIDKFKGSGQSVLVVDDVEEQRKIAADSLKLLGYTPFVVSSGEKAIEFIRNHPVDLMLLDMKMDPGIDGYDTYAQTLEFRPDQKAVIASGFSANERVKKTLALGAGQYIRKPFTLKNLARAIQKELSTG